MKLNMSLYTQPSSPSSDLTTTPFLGSTPSPTLYQLTLFNIFNRPSPNNNQSELDEYLAVSQILFNSDSFSWWRINKGKFSIISELAYTYLLVSATSTLSERLFSDCGNLMGPKRTRINPEFFKRLMFLKRNFGILDSIHPPK